MDETWISPVVQIPVTDLSGRVAVSEVELANGERVIAALSNVDCQDPKRTSVFLSATFYSGGNVYHLARYFDPDYDTSGPDGLAEFLGLETNQVFPISYDLSRVASGDGNALKATIERTPKTRLSDDDLIALLV